MATPTPDEQAEPGFDITQTKDYIVATDTEEENETVILVVNKRKIGDSTTAYVPPGETSLFRNAVIGNAMLSSRVLENNDDEE